MKILIFPDAEQAVARVVDLIIAQIKTKPKSVLGLATGGTMVDVYRNLIEVYRKNGISFADISTFNLDEYVGVSPESPASYSLYMRQHLFSKVDILEQNTHLPKGLAKDLDIECLRYEAHISSLGGIDLQLLGIGSNGHIGFNEPTSSLNSRTRIKTLTASTMQANQRFFDRPEDVPRYAITMGIRTILDAKHCLLLAIGKTKAKAIANAIEGPVAAVCPASALQYHPNTTIILDPDAARDLVHTEYYQQVHPNGMEADL